MKKFLLICFLGVLIFGFGAAGSLHALPYVGTFDCLEASCSYGAADLDIVINKWNDANGPPDLPNLVVGDPEESLCSFEKYVDSKSGKITWTGDWTYLSVKYSQYIDVFYIVDTDGTDGIIWSPLPLYDHDFSHCKLWDLASIPEPATMLLVGFGLIGLGVFGRKKLFKKS